MTGFAACDPPIWLAVTSTSLDDAVRARTRFSQLLNLRVFQHRVVGGSSSAKADSIGGDLEEETDRWIISLASISRWTRPMFAFSTAKGRSFARARRRRQQRRSPANCRKRRVVIASYSRRGEWRRSCFTGNELGLPVVCVESRQAYQALKSLATHKTDRNDARGLAHLARTGFFKPVHVKSLRAQSLKPFYSQMGQPSVDPETYSRQRVELTRRSRPPGCLLRPRIGA